ncbi:uncharacterized protein LOC125857915 [Solanum stenotomum]|uniref:uncharacterized protein LOC125857915 n=1 Tax=Solanum stenotomum TaxID=172797 RepID=UPI0020D04E77|nr:uncharacterized protein LOC125857915 [Solanum stenotomum]
MEDCPSLHLVDNLEGNESKMFYRKTKQYLKDKDKLPRALLFLEGGEIDGQPVGEQQNKDNIKSTKNWVEGAFPSKGSENISENGDGKQQEMGQNSKELMQDKGQNNSTNGQEGKQGHEPIPVDSDEGMSTHEVESQEGAGGILDDGIDRGESDGMAENIDNASKSGDLSPRQVDTLHNKGVKSHVPLQGPGEIHHYRTLLGFDNALVNQSGKIWIFWKAEWDGSVLLDSPQQLSLKFNTGGKQFIISSIYARCTEVERLELWDELESLNGQGIPWMVGGDFNVILNEEEKLGGLPFIQHEATDFANCINVCALIEVKFAGSKYTWWNGRINDACIFERLDRVLVNQEFLQLIPQVEVENFFQQGSDHAPIHVTGSTDVIKVKEAQFEIDPSSKNRSELGRVEANLKRFLKVEEDFWRQKAGKRRKLAVDEIEDRDGNIISEKGQMGEEAVKVFQHQFQEESFERDFSMVENIPQLITSEENDRLTRLPDGKEVKRVVFQLDGTSAAGPNGYTGFFFQQCWDIISSDVVNVVKAFFCGQCLPRIVEVLPKLISPNQTGFVKGRNITENVLLAQEIIGDINKRKKNTIVVVKLDMTKAYDRVSWVFLTKVMRKFGFSEVIIDMSYGLFQSSRGLKQGDPLSPTLFIIAVEVLSRGLNKLYDDPDFIGYGLPKWSPKINHLSYADDTILFCSGERRSIIKMMRVLRDYEEVSGQLINKAKSCFYLHENTPLVFSMRLRKLTGIRQGDFPFTYLGCSVFHGRKCSIYFEDLIRKIARNFFLAK